MLIDWIGCCTIEFILKQAHLRLFRMKYVGTNYWGVYLLVSKKRFQGQPFVYCLKKLVLRVRDFFNLSSCHFSK